ncbi:PREDICTED: tax1-binding protein 3-like [Branchiostoma belcheri]|uniref:Tax1-binding protein 3 n=1 Tax=Branchiostoma belcheri TaxID=7741 RepID=A0A6P4ZX35_BRABE|nr:PREDICTED: tax1-binding protein 3-like [Branchiostoma belcheri]
MAAGSPIGGIPCLLIEIVKEPVGGSAGLGFSIGGGIDQDASRNPWAPDDTGIFVTNVMPDGPAARAGLNPGDKILQANGYDLTMATHKDAIKYLTKKKEQVIRLKIFRPDILRTRGNPAM